MKNLYDYYVLLMNNPGFGLFIVLSCGCLHSKKPLGHKGLRVFSCSSATSCRLSFRRRCSPKTWVRDCGHFIGLNGNFHFTSEFCWAQSAKRQLNSFIPIPNHVSFNLLHKVLQCNTLPRATVEHLVLHPPEESLTG